MAFNIPNDLAQTFKENKSSFLIGAGLSIPAGLPSWNGLLEYMIEKYSGLPYKLDEKLDDYKMLLTDPNNLLMIAEDLKETLSLKVYNDILEEKFGQPDVKPTENHELIIKLNPQFIITLNYDRLIENAFNKINGYFPNFFTYKQSREAANSFWKGKFFVFKAHGDAFSDSSNLILTQKDYRKVLFRENGYRSLIQTMFTSKSMLMLGLSMTDPEFKLLLEYLHDSYHTGGPTHYLLIEKDKACNTTMKRYLDDFNIQTITFDNADGSYKEITEFLKKLYTDVNA